MKEDQYLVRPDARYTGDDADRSTPQFGHHYAWQHQQPKMVNVAEVSSYITRTNVRGHKYAISILTHSARWISEHPRLAATMPRRSAKC
ncbi:MAG: hypothetical protein IPQ00_00030 [Chloracidobacterium sp.]|nr:hypothetical protein [Chloracidobacterium sp.]